MSDKNNYEGQGLVRNFFDKYPKIEENTLNVFRECDYNLYHFRTSKEFRKLMHSLEKFKFHGSIVNFTERRHIKNAIMKYLRRVRENNKSICSPYVL